MAWRSVAIFVLALMLGACSGARNELYVSAASSLAGAFGDIEKAFETQHPDIDVILNLGGSSTLGYQILEAAPIDVFASADTAVMTDVDSARLLTSSPVNFAVNRLQIIVPAGNPGSVEDITSFGNEDLLLGVCAHSVPCGHLAEFVLNEADIEGHFVSRETNVKALVTKVAKGELDAGLVYVTDTDPGVEVIPIDSQLTNIYPIATISERPEAREFVDFVVSEDGLRILGQWGFGQP